MIRDELAMLGNPVDDNTLALRVLSGLPAEYGMLRTVLEIKERKLVMSDVTAKLLQVEQRSQAGGASKPAGGVKSQAFAAAAAKKPWAKKEVVCFYCDKKGHMQRQCHKKKADEAKGWKKPGGGRRDGGEGGGPHVGAALAYTASAGQVGRNKAQGSTSGSSTWVLDSGATSHMAAGDKGFTVKSAGSGAKVTLANGDKVPIKGHGRVSMDVGKGNTKKRMVLNEAMLVPGLTSNLLSVRAVDRHGGAVVFVGDACYILNDGDAFYASGVLAKASVVGKVNSMEQCSGWGTATPVVDCPSKELRRKPKHNPARPSVGSGTTAKPRGKLVAKAQSILSNDDDGGPVHPTRTLRKSRQHRPK